MHTRTQTHPSTIEAEATVACAAPAFVFIYDYHPLAETLASRYLSGVNPQPIPETTLWAYVMQLASALRTIHVSGKACRSLDASKVLVTGHNRCDPHADAPGDRMPRRREQRR